LQAVVRLVQVPEQGLVFTGQVGRQRVPSQRALPPTGAGHGEQEVPQVAGSMLLAQASPQRWKPGAQVKVHVSPSQEAAPLAEVGQEVQPAPQALRLRASTQTPPQRLLPARQLPSQAALAATHRSRQGF
jgi:hypothetical protein